MKTEPKLPDLLNVLIPQIEELTESIKKTKDVQKQIDDRLQKLSEMNTDIDTKRMESILREFENGIAIQCTRIFNHREIESKKTFLSSADFKLILLALLSTFCFALAMTGIFKVTKTNSELKKVIYELKVKNDTK